MKFDEFETLYQIARKTEHLREYAQLPPVDFYLEIAKASEYRTDPDDHPYIIRTVQEGLWYLISRPFYKVWPGIIPCLTKTRLDITLNDLKLEKNAFAAFLPAGQGSVLVTTNPQPALAITVQKSDGNAATATVHDAAKPLEEAITHHPEFTPMLRIAIAIIMLDNDPTIIDREVLSKDRLKWEQTRDPKYIEKAAKRGINGWRIGEKIEVLPHFRRPHFAIRWTGPGRTIPKLRPISGSIVHRDLVTKVPTGRLDVAPSAPT